MRKTVRLGWRVAIALLSAVALVSSAPGAAPPYPKHLKASRQGHRAGKTPTIGYVFEEITIPGGLSVYPYDINNAGVVAGTYYDSSTYKMYTFLWYQGEWVKIAKADPQTGIEEDMSSVATLTDSGILFGNWGSSTSQHVGYYNPKTGEWTTLPDYVDPARPFLYGQRMNNSGVAIGGACEGMDPYGYVFGCICWIWDGQYRTVEVPGYTVSPTMSGINEHGEIVIQSDSEPVVTPFNPLRAYWLAQGNLSLIVLPETPTSLGTEYAGIYDVNNRDEVIMMAPLDDPSGYYVPLMYDYRHQIVTRLPNVPLAVCEAGGAFYTGMNDQGALVGVCWEILEDFTFVQHAFVAHKN